MTEHKASAIIAKTGEVIELNIGTANEVTEAYELIEQTLNAYRDLKRQVTDRGMEILKRKEE